MAGDRRLGRAAPRGLTPVGRRVQRIASLVPSLTEFVWAVGCGSTLVARTRFCVEPPEVTSVEAVGGTKDPNVGRIVDLRPDLVLMSAEENRREDYEALVAAGISVWVTHPRSVAQALAELDRLGTLIGAKRQTATVLTRCRRALERCRLQRERLAPIATFCPIWRNPWMTIGGRTYVNDVLCQCGFANVFAGRGDDFFEVTAGEVAERRPEVVLLPDEPYRFALSHGEELRRAGVSARCVPVLGRDLTWYGPRIGEALDRLCTLRRRLEPRLGRRS